MSQLRFNHVFVGLLALSVLSAFVLPARITNPARANVQNIFAPVAAPVRKIASAISGRVSADKLIDDARHDGSHREVKDVLDENAQLRQRIASISGQLEELARINAERAMIGEDLRKLCTPVSVFGGDSGTRQSLSLMGTSLDGIREGMAVLYPGGVAGQVERVGVGGAQVRLVTDTDSKLICVFKRFTRDANGRIDFQRIVLPAQGVPFPPQVAEGAGNGRLVVKHLAARDVDSAGVAVNDWVVLEDPEWPLILRGQKIGKIIDIHTSYNGPLFKDVMIEPAQRLMTLREVMVVTKGKG
jgi:cell shape-determining protein MreC